MKKEKHQILNGRKRSVLKQDLICGMELEVAGRVGDHISSYGGLHLIGQVQVPGVHLGYT